MRDVTYVLSIPPVVKQEKGEDDDELVIVGSNTSHNGPTAYQGSEEGGPFTAALSEQRCRNEGSL